VATTEQQPKPDAQDEQGNVKQHSCAEEKLHVAPLRFINQAGRLVDSASSVEGHVRVSAKNAIVIPLSQSLATLYSAASEVLLLIWEGQPPHGWASKEAVSWLIFLCDLRRRIRLLGVPPWRFAFGWRSRSTSDSLLMPDYYDTGQR
jgi:hypothetical protein